MINEKMLELLLLEKYCSNSYEFEYHGNPDYILVSGKLYDKQILNERLKELRWEFLESYIIDSTSKED